MSPIAISDEAMRELIELARPLDPRDQTRFVEVVVAEDSACAPGSRAAVC